MSTSVFAKWFVNSLKVALWAHLSFHVHVGISAKLTAIFGYQRLWTSTSVFGAFVDPVLFKHSVALPVWLTRSRNLQIESKVHCLRNSVLLSFKKPPAPKCVQESRRNKQRSLTLYPSHPAYAVPTVSNSHHETNIEVQIQELEEHNYNCSTFKQLKLLDNIYTVI